MIITKTCTNCGRTFEIEITEDAYQQYLNGELIQYAMPDLGAGLRELFISGLCSDCWDRIFEGEEEQD